MPGLGIGDIYNEFRKIIRISGRLKNIPFKFIRMTWDIIFLLLGWFLGGNIGVVTFAVAFFLGPVITWEQKKLAVFIS